jgi:hypothetical protein
MRNAGVLIAIALAPLAAAGAGDGVEVGARVGYAIPRGEVGPDGSGNGIPFSTWVEHALPIDVDVGYRFNPYVYGGVYGGYSVISRAYCETGDCSDHGFRVGANVQLHPLGQVPVDPWIGLGFGYEWLSFSQRFPSGNDDRMLEGFEVAILEIGIDFAVSSSPVIKLGPVATFSLATFRRETIANAGSIDIDAGLHEWLVLGFRARFLP